MAVTLTAPPVPAARTTLTPDDLLALEAEHGVHYELVNGELRGARECRIQSMHLSEGRISFTTWLAYRRHCSRCDRLDCSFTLKMIQCGYASLTFPSSRLQRICLKRGSVPAPFTAAPDLAIEVVSPTDKAGELAVKTADYLAAGTQQVWIVEPNTRTVAVYRPGGAARVYGADDTLDGGDLLPDLALPVGDLFDYGVAAPSRAE